MISEEDFLKTYDIKKLDERFSVSDFDCGDEDLNGFIRTEAHFYREQLLAMPYVLTEKDKIDRILAYFTLANDKISVTEIQEGEFQKREILEKLPVCKGWSSGNQQGVAGAGNRHSSFEIHKNVFHC